MECNPRKQSGGKGKRAPMLPKEAREKIQRSKTAKAEKERAAPTTVKRQALFLHPLLSVPGEWTGWIRRQEESCALQLRPDGRGTEGAQRASQPHTHPPSPALSWGSPAASTWLTFVAQGAGDKEEEEEEERGGGEGHPPAHFSKALEIPAGCPG